MTDLKVVVQHGEVSVNKEISLHYADLQLKYISELVFQVYTIWMAKWRHCTVLGWKIQYYMYSNTPDSNALIGRSLN